MVSIFQPRFPTQPSPAGATVATTTFPTELAPFIKDILEKSKAQQEGAAYQAYTGPQLAQFTDAERAAMEAMRQQTTGLAGTDVAQATPYFTGAKTAAEGLGKQFTGDTAQQFMNPYQQAVVDQAKRKAVEDYERNIAPAVTAQAIAQQPFGGSRQAISEAMARENLADRLTDIQERGLASAFDKGRAAFEAQKGRELQQAQQLTQLGQTIPQQALRDLAVQQQLGEQERQQEQLALDLAKGQFMEEREFPTRALQEYSAIVRGFPFQPSTYQTSTQYQATPSVANQLLQLGGAGMGAYTQFTGKPLGNLFGMANQGGGIADIVSNQMGMNQQMKTEEDFIRDMYYQDSKTLPVDEFYNKYGIGGENRKTVEGIIDEESLPTETAPFRIREVMTESAVGAPPGPLPSQEEIEMMERNRLLQERDMRRMFNQGGLVTIYNAEADNEQLSGLGIVDTLRTEENPSENIDNIYTLDTLQNPTDDPNVAINNVAPSAEEMGKLYTGIAGTMPSPVSDEMQSVLDEAKDLKFTNTFRDALTKEDSPFQTAKGDVTKRFTQLSDPESDLSKEAKERAIAARASIEGKGLTKAALSLDPTASFVQNISQLLAGAGDAVGDGRQAYNELVEKNLQDQFNAAAGVLDVETNYLNLMEKADQLDQVSNENQIRLINNKLSNFTQASINSGNISAELLKTTNDMKIKELQLQLENVRNINDRKKIENQIAEINNNSKYSKVLAAVNVMDSKEKSLSNRVTESLKGYEIDETFQYNNNKLVAETDLANSKQFMGDMEKLRKEIQSQFSMLYDADGAYIGGDAPDIKDLRAYSNALDEARKRYIANQVLGLANPLEGVNEIVIRAKETAPYGVPYFVFQSLDNNGLTEAKSYFKLNTNSSAVDRLVNIFNKATDSQQNTWNGTLFKDQGSYDRVKEALRK